MIAFVLEIVLFSILTFNRRKKPFVALAPVAACILILALLTFLGKVQVLGRLGDLSSRNPFG